ncbi:MAG: polysaccharide deacetylase family protein [Gammaproteobacteria bacterium]|nr:polysaccharide deacetylase family protein [Gammaproteobacteria bacterium]
MDKYLHYIKYSIKLSIAYTLFYSGILFLIKNVKFKNKHIVVTYHRILPEELKSTSFSNDGIIVRPESFSKQLDFLSKHFNVTNIDAFYSALLNKTISEKNNCLITFDDGWIDNYLYAFPLLKKHKLPATIFIPTGYIEKNELFWQEKLSRSISILLKNTSPEAKNLITQYNLDALLNHHGNTLRSLIINHVNELKSHPYEEVDEMYNSISLLTGNIHSEENIDRYMNWSQVKELSNNNINFESHAHSHKILTRLDLDEAAFELESSLKTISERVDHKVKYIAYPNGNSNSEIQKLAKNTGYLLGFGTKPGTTSSDDNYFDIKRINIHENKSSNVPLFFMSLLGIF